MSTVDLGTRDDETREAESHLLASRPRWDDPDRLPAGGPCTTCGSIAKPHGVTACAAGLSIGRWTVPPLAHAEEKAQTIKRARERREAAEAARAAIPPQPRWTLPRVKARERPAPWPLSAFTVRSDDRSDRIEDFVTAGVPGLGRLVRPTATGDSPRNRQGGPRVGPCGEPRDVVVYETPESFAFVRSVLLPFVSYRRTAQPVSGHGRCPAHGVVWIVKNGRRRDGSQRWACSSSRDRSNHRAVWRREHVAETPEPKAVCCGEGGTCDPCPLR